VYKKKKKSFVVLECWSMISRLLFKSYLRCMHKRRLAWDCPLEKIQTNYKTDSILSNGIWRETHLTDVPKVTQILVPNHFSCSSIGKVVKFRYIPCSTRLTSGGFRFPFSWFLCHTMIHVNVLLPNLFGKWTGAVPRFIGSSASLCCCACVLL
jgi:hypothetical protein